MKKTLLALLFLPLLAFGQYTHYVAIGDSLTAGFVSGGLCETYQKNSYPALIARQLGIAGFEQPLVSEPGIPIQLELQSLSPLVIAPKGGMPGVPLNLTLPRPYDNLAVAGATLSDCLTKKDDGGGMHSLVLRGIGSQVEQAIALQPDLLTVWIGANDALGAALMGTAVEGVTLTPKDAFRMQYAHLLDLLASHTAADIVVANVPPVTVVPFVTTIPPYIINPATGQPVVGPDGQPMTYLGQSDDGSPFIGPDALVTLNAKQFLLQGYGIPTALGGNGSPLPSSVVLTPAETAMIEDYIASYNASIAELAADRGVPVVDMHAILSGYHAHGLEIAGMELTTEFLSGGLFGYDGFHPSALGMALEGNAFIEAINAGYGAHIRPIGLAPFLSGEATFGGGAVDLETLELRGWEYWMKLFAPEHFIFGKGSLR
jgi:lysophospholipase L1-like esterase